MRITFLVTCLSVSLAAGPAFADKISEAIAKAEQQLAKGKAEDARKTLEKLVEQNPGSADARVALSRFQVREGEWDAALLTLQEGSSAASGADKATLLAALSELELHTASGAQALSHAREAVATAETPAAYAALARALVRIQDYPGALENARKAVAGGSNANTQEALGEALAGVGKYSEAAAALRQALQLSPADAHAGMWLATVLLEQGKTAEAVAEARRAADENPHSGEAYAVLGTALLAQDKNNWGEAIAQAQQGAFLEPKNPRVQYAVAQIFEAQGNVQQAAAAYQRALDSDPAFVPAQVALVQVQERRGELDSALAEARKLVQSAPESGQANLLLGRLLLRKNEFAEAVAPLTIASRQLPGSASAHALLGTAQQYAGNSTGAAEAYAKAVEVEPDNIAYEVTYGLLLGLAGNGAKGVEVLKSVVSKPSYKEPAAWLNLGWIYRNMDPRQPEASVDAYKKALQFEPDSAQAYLGLGWAYTYLKDYDACIASFQKTVQLEPKLAVEAYNGTGWCYYFKREADKAKQALEKARQAGRGDERLAGKIAEFEKAVAEGRAQTEEEWRKQQEEAERQRERFERYERAVENLKKGGPDDRARALKDMYSSIGAEGMDFYVYALADAEPQVKEAACQVLGQIGPGAKKAVRHIQGIIEIQMPTFFENDAEAKRWLRLSDAQRACREALQKIQR